MTEQPFKENNRFVELDALRGIAAIVVCIFHFSMANPSPIFNIKIFQYGATGVDLFFIISGFVIFMSINKVRSVKSFWVARFIRLFPAYWLSLIIAILSVKFVLGLPVGHWSVKYLLGNIFMLQPLFKSEGFVHAYWTLYVELCFYAFISLVKYFKLTNRIETLIWIGLAMQILINSTFILFGNLPIIVRLFTISRSIMPLIAYFCFFANGIVYYRIYKNGFTKNRIALLITGFLITFLIHNITGLFNLFFGTIERVICVLLINVVFLLFVTGKARILKSSILYFLGAISYSLYLIHESIGIHVYKICASKLRLDITLATFIGIFTSIAIATIMTFFFERPVSKYLKLKLSSKT